MKTSTMSIRAFYWIIVLLSSACQHKQDYVSPSLLQEVALLTDKANATKYHQLDSAIHYTQLALDLVERESLGSIHKLPLLMQKSELFDRMGLADSAAQVVAATEKLLSVEDDPYQKALLSYCKGLHHFFTYQYEKAENHLQDAGAYFLQNMEDPKAGTIFYHLGLFYARSGQLPRAHDFYLKASESFLNNADTLNYNATQIQIAQLYQQQQLKESLTEAITPYLSLLQNTPSAKLPYKQLQQLALAVQDTLPALAEAWQTQAAQEALIAGDTLNYHLSMTHFAALQQQEAYAGSRDTLLKQAIRSFEKFDAKTSNIVANQTLAKSLVSQKKYPDAQSVLQDALAIANELENPAETLPVLDNLYNLHLTTGKLAVAKQTKYQIDSLHRVLDQKNATTSLEYLKKAQSIAQIEHQQSLLDVQLQLQAKKLRFRNIVILLLVLTAILFTWLAIKVYRNNQRKKDAMKVLLESYKAELHQLTEDQKQSDQNEDLPIAKRKEQLLELMTSQKIYLQSELKVEDITEVMQITYKDLSQLLKEEFQTSFKNFVNQYRIEHAKALLLAPEYQHLSIEGIGMESGFGSKQNFYKTFQQITGVTPGEFKQLIDINP